MLQELSIKIEDLKKYSQGAVSTEMVEIFDTLAKYDASLPIANLDLIFIYRNLEDISNKARPQESKNWTQQMLNRLHKVVEADKISQEIDSYFEEIKNAFSDCEVCVCDLTCNTFS